MLIKALCDYYDVLAKENKVLPGGYSAIDVSYLICLSPEGRVDSIIDWRKRETVTDKKGKEKEVIKPKQIQVPARTEKPGIDGNIIEHRPLYIFGLNYDKGILDPNDKTDKAKKSHEVFLKTNLDFIEGLDSLIVNAYRNFMQSWNPEEETGNEVLLSVGKDFPTAKYAFCLAGHPEILLHEDEQINRKWAAFSKAHKSPHAACAQCSVTGEIEEIARIHSKIKGFNAMGSVLVNFNNPSELSYNREQAFNSNVSARAMVKYTEALNYLLADKKHRTNFGDVTVIHWAASGDDRCSDVFSYSFSDDPEIDDDSLKAFMTNVAEGRTRLEDIELAELGIDDKTDFYIVGMKPNSSRIAVKFIYRRKFGELIRNIAAHQRDLKFSDGDKTVSFRTLIGVLSPPKESNHPVDPSLTAKLLDAAVNGYRYPASLLYSSIRRITIDGDGEYYYGVKYNDIRKRIIKATINRNARLSGKKEEINLALDKENRSPAYLCGRLFAELEELQQKAANYSLNRTIRDSYFASAAAHPSALFPRIMKLSQYHLSKLGNPKYAEDQIAEIMDKLGGEFPQALNQTEQGKFIIGYYHQKSYLDEVKKSSKANKTNSEGEAE